MIRLHLRGRLGLISGIASLALLAAVPAVPASADDGAEEHTVTTTTMTYEPVLATAPSGDGLTTVLTLRNGHTVTVPAAAWAQSLAAQQAKAALARKTGLRNVVNGDCGSSSIDIKRKSNGHPIHVRTGFIVIDWAISYNWEYMVRGPQNYAHTENPSGGLNFQHTWSDTFDTPHNERNGYWQSWVVPGESYALTDSGLCWSGAPVAVGDY